MQRVLTAKQRKAWQAIAQHKRHPWYTLAVCALAKDQWYKQQQRKIKKIFKELKNSTI